MIASLRSIFTMTRLIHPAVARQQFREFAAEEIDNTNLARGALLIALEDNPHIEVEHYLGLLDDLAARVQKRCLPGEPPIFRLGHLHAEMFDADGYVVECTGYRKENEDDLVVLCKYDPDTRSGTPGAEKVKVKGNIHWVSAEHAHPAPVRLYDRLFRVPQPGTERDFLEDLNPDSMKLVAARLEPSLRTVHSRERFQFERHGYFVADPKELAFNRTVTLRDSWSK